MEHQGSLPLDLVSEKNATSPPPHHPSSHHQHHFTHHHPPLSAQSSSGGAGSGRRRQWTLPRRLMSLGFTGLSRTVSNIESRYARNDSSDGNEVPFRYLTGNEWQTIQQELIDEYGFSIDQLVELAGLAIASAITKTYPTVTHGTTTKVLVCCGSAMGGGYGLVAARHLKLFGFRPTIFYPIPSKQPSFNHLIKQCQEYEISFLSYLPNEWRLIGEAYHLIVDCMYDGTNSMNGSMDTLLSDMLGKIVDVSNSGTPVVSVDVPFGWDVEKGPTRDSASRKTSRAEPDSTEANKEGATEEVNRTVSPDVQSLTTGGNRRVLLPDCLLSTLAPKLCSQQFTGKMHWLAGRFTPPSMKRKYVFNFPPFPNTELVVLLSQREDI